MKNIYLYQEVQNNSKLAHQEYREDTPNQFVSNQSYLSIKEYLHDYNYNFDFLYDTVPTYDDVVIVNNLQPFIRNSFHSFAISLKRKLMHISKLKKNIYFNLSNHKNKKNSQNIIPYLWESDTVMPSNWNLNNHRSFNKILTWNRELIDNKKYFECNLQAGPLTISDLSEKVSRYFDRKIFFSTIHHNKVSYKQASSYIYRLALIDYFSRNLSDSFYLYGTGWDTESSFVGEYTTDYKYSDKEKDEYLLHWRKYSKSIQTAYKGTAPSKQIILNNSKFVLCIENNLTTKGYLTEKIFDVIKCGAIPVYLGAPDINDLVPQEAFIDLRKFGVNYQSLHQYLMSITNHQYDLMQESGREFLTDTNSKAAKYLPCAIAKQLINAIEN